MARRGVTGQSANRGFVGQRGNGRGTIGSGAAFGVFVPVPKLNGGTVTFVGDDVVHTFTTSGTLTPVSAAVTVRALVVAGGGAGAQATDRTGGGGGGGGVLQSSSLSISAAETVTVGAGGTAEGNGQNSSIGSLLVAIGGGRGARASLVTGGTGGSGGGRYHSASSVAGAGTAGQGFAGGVGFDSGSGTGNFGAGGGGGAGGVGGNAQTTGAAGAGGPGVSSDITGTSRFYGGGGGGTAQDNDAATAAYVGGAGGNGGGGAGASQGVGVTAVSGASGTANTGGGGGGGRTTAATAGAGGSGVVVVRYTATEKKALTPPAVPAFGKTALGVGTFDPTTDLTAFLTSSQQTSISTWMTFTTDNGTFAKAITDIGTVNNTIGHTVPLEIAWGFPGSTTLAGTAAGNDDAYITARANELKNYAGPVYLRLNWEMNGDWYPWASYTADTPKAGNTPADYIAAWRRTYGIVKAIAPNASFVWCPHLWVYHTQTPDLWYPGDAYVDWNAVTVYPGSADWTWIQDGDWGLEVNADFAEAHSKPLRFCEWGTGQGESGTNVGIFYQMKDWITAHPVLREIVYFHMNGLNGVNYRLGAYPDWEFAYRTDFTGNPARYPQA